MEATDQAPEAQESIFFFEGEVAPEPQVEAEAPAAPAEEPSAKTISPKEQERRAEQSQLDKAKAENERLQVKLAELEKVSPVQQLLDRDPGATKALNDYIASLNGGQPQAARVADAPAVEALPEMPTPPERPLTYNLDDAKNDPDSESFKYDHAEQKYFRDLAKWNADVLLAQQEAAKAERERIRLEAEQAQHFNAAIERSAKLYGVPEDRKEEYRRFVVGMTAEDEERAVANYFIQKTLPSAEEVANKRRADELQRQAKAAEEIPVPGGATSAGEEVKQEQESIFGYQESATGGRMI